MSIFAPLKVILFAAVGAISDWWGALLHPRFNQPFLICLLPVLLLAAIAWGKRQVGIRHSSLAPHKNFALAHRWSLTVVSAYAFLCLSATQLDLAIMGPTLPAATIKHLMQTRNICAVIDSSGSMTTPLLDNVKDLSDDEAKAKADPTAVTVDNRGSDKYFVAGKKKGEKPHPMTRAEAAQLAVRYLIRHLMSDDPANTDRLCLMRFDDDLYMMAPFSNDKRALSLRTVHITENVGGGTNFIKALQKAYDYETLNTENDSARVVIMVTDGYDTIDPDKRADFVSMYKDAHIKLYVIGLGEGWKNAQDMDLQKQADELHAADPTSGLVFSAANPGDMKQAMATIERLEKAQEIWESTNRYRDVDYVFIFGSMSCIVVFFCLGNVSGRRP